MLRGEFENLWPLQLVDLRDEEMVGTLFRLLRRVPQVRHLGSARSLIISFVCGLAPVLCFCVLVFVKQALVRLPEGGGVDVRAICEVLAYRVLM